MRILTTTALVALVLSGSAALAQQGNPGGHFLEQWDADANGTVTLAEAEAKRGEVFYMFDSTGDKQLDATEWAAVAEHMAAELGNPPGQGAGQGRGPGAIMHEAMTPAFNDADGDGAVTEAEFVAATQKLFGLLDRTGDDVLTSADFGPAG